MRDLTAEVLDNIQKHVDETGTLPNLSTPESRSAAQREREKVANEIEGILVDLERDPFPEESELLRAVRAGEHWIDSDFWGPHLMVWEARLEHYQNNESAYQEKGIKICRTTQYYSYHACEVMRVAVTDMHENHLFSAKPVRPSWDSEKECYNKDGKSAWEHAREKMKAAGFTHFFHRGSLPVNTGATPYKWMDVVEVEKGFE